MFKIVYLGEFGRLKGYKKFGLRYLDALRLRHIENLYKHKIQNAITLQIMMHFVQIEFCFKPNFDVLKMKCVQLKNVNIKNVNIVVFCIFILLKLLNRIVAFISIF